MSQEYEYDAESGSFRPRQMPKRESDVGGWIVIALLFLSGVLWPLGLFLFIRKLRGERTGSADRAYAAEPAQREELKTDKAAKRAAKKTRRALKSMRNTADALTISGAILAAVFAIATGAVFLEDYLYTGLLDDLIATFLCSGFCAGGVTMLVSGLRMRKRSARIARYQAAIGEREWVHILELCGVVGKERKVVERDLEVMIEKGLLGAGAYFDAGRGVLFRSADAARRYSAEHEKKTEPPNKARETGESFADALRAIHCANDRIADPALSQQLDHMEFVAGKILREIEEHPEKRAQATTFLNYYLPTTLKLIGTYAEFEEAGIEGENLRKAKERISAIMETLSRGFDKQLDELYRSEAMDIDSDIRVVEQMLSRDLTSAAEDFGLDGGTAVQQQET